MRSIKDIEKLSLEQLNDISADESIKVPGTVSLGIQDVVNKDIRNRKIIRLAGLAVVLGLCIGLGNLNQFKEPKDTFDDPYLAYAEVEKALSKVSESMKKGMDMVDGSDLFK